MKLVAIYIKEHFLFDDAQTINFGGAHFYKFKKEGENIEIEQIKNENYIDNFFNDNILLLSAIVGANGTGKTTIMSIINKFSDFTKSIFLYEINNDKLIVENRTGDVDASGNPIEKNQMKVFFNGSELYSNPSVDIPILYYSPIADYDLINFRSPISKTNHFKSTLIEYHLDNVERNTMFMVDDLAYRLKDVFPEFPSYNFLNINAKPLFKRDLRNTYGGFEVEGDIEKSQKVTLDQLWGSYKTDSKNNDHLTHNSDNLLKNIEVNILSYLVIDGTSMGTVFNGNYEIGFKEILEENNFRKKLKHFFFNKVAYIDKYIFNTIQEHIKGDNYEELSLLFESDIFNNELERKKKYIKRLFSELIVESKSVDEDSLFLFLDSKFNTIINDELRGEEFEGIRNNLIEYLDFIHPKFDQEEKEISKLVQKNLKDIFIGLDLSFENLIQTRLNIIGQLKEKAKRTILLFSSIKSFYLSICDLKKKEGFNIQEGNLKVNLKQIDFEEFKLLINNYKNLVVNFNSNSIISAQILEFKPDKKLSFGEKSILNLFSSLYEFTLSKNNHLRQKNRYLLLLDESDLGFHPLWKRKYIQSISKVVPLIFSKMNPKVHDEENRIVDNPDFESPQIQVIVTTHDPLTLSDIPNYNITYLDKGNNEKSRILNIWSDIDRPIKSFGANITDLLSDSFFIDDGLIGDFAKGKINRTIKWLSDEKRNVSEKKNHERIINLIDEPVLQFKLKEMYDDIFLNETDREYKENELKRIAKKYNIEIDIKKEI